jgi:hypothetical protein
LIVSSGNQFSLKDTGDFRLAATEKKLLNVVDPVRHERHIELIDSNEGTEPMNSLVASVLSPTQTLLALFILVDKNIGDKSIETEDKLMSYFCVTAGIALQNALDHQANLTFTNALANRVEDSTSFRSILHQALCPPTSDDRRSVICAFGMAGGSYEAFCPLKTFSRPSLVRILETQSRMSQSTFNSCCLSSLRIAHDPLSSPQPRSRASRVCLGSGETCESILRL